MSPLIIGPVLIGLSIAMYFTGKFATIRSIMVFAGILLVGLTGWLITHLAMLFSWISGWAGPWIATLTGWGTAAVGATLFAVLAYFVFHDWAPRNQAKKRTYWLSIALAIIIVAGAAPIAALNQLPASVQTGVTTTGG
jgi:MFS family permease